MRTLLVIVFIQVGMCVSPSWAAVEGPPLTRIVGSDAPWSNDFGFDVDISGNLMVVGSPGQSFPGASIVGAAYVFSQQASGGWIEVARLAASDGAQWDGFGCAVAIHGGRVVVGAYRDDDHGDRSGAGYVFDQGSTGTWTETQKLLPSDGQAVDEFGFDVALDGDTIVVGTNDAQAAYVFEQDATGAWVEVAILTPLSGQDGFGQTVATCGALTLVGEPYGYVGGTRCGAARLFERDSTGAWNPIQRLEPSNPQPGAWFSQSVSLAEGLLAVGAPSDAEFVNLGGAVHVFEHDPSGTWLESAKLVPQDLTDGDKFGFAVACREDAVFVGAPFHGNDGAAYVFKGNESGGWMEMPQLLAEAPTVEDKLGRSIAIDQDGLAIGAPGGISAYAVNIGAFMSITPYGAGCPGDGGIVPYLEMGGNPISGGTVYLGVEDAVGGSVVLFAFGAQRATTPFGAGCNIRVGPAPLALLGPFALFPVFGSGAGNGSLCLPILIPPAVPSMTLMVQAFVPDGASARGYSNTNGVEFSVN